ncbi:MAG: putative F420-dependent oxidoreductase [Solirubrobacterales bacterium]|nr:putative F420-dependent oxidoreductase [Solirubrobacterales bacterium]
MTATDVPAVRSSLGKVGVWFSAISSRTAVDAGEAAREIEGLGYGCLWVGEAPNGKEALTHSGLLLAATSTLVVATGIANIYARDPMAMQLGALTLGEAYPGRFVLGIGVSHRPLVAARGHDYGKPLSAMREYLDGMAAAEYLPPAPAQPVPVVLAALRPRMLELAAERTAGAHPYFVPVEHTAKARATLGPDPLLAPELMVILEEDAETARATARRTTAMYLGLPNYVNNLLELGYTDEDVAGGGSDRLVDDIVAWGSPAAIKERVDAHLAAGADHVPIQPVGGRFADQMQQLRTLAPVLLA